MECYGAYKSWGLLPYGGGVLDQPPGVMAALSMLDYMVSWHSANEEKEGDLPDIDNMEE